MSLRCFVRVWNDLFFEKKSPVPIALFRILYGLLVISTLGLLRPDWLSWYGVHGWVSLPTALKLEPGHRLNLFSIIPQSDAWVEALFWAALASAISLTCGLFTRINSILVFVFLTSIQQRNLYITHGGDTFLRMAGFFLIRRPFEEIRRAAVSPGSRPRSREIFNPIRFPALATIRRKRLFSME
jgi:hypothetical protein